MASYDFRMVPVVGADQQLVGVVTDRDLVVLVLAKGLDPNQVDLGTIATTKNIATIGPDETLREAEDRMAEHRVKRLPVLKGDELVGVVALGDVAVTAASPRNVGEAVAEISRSPATEEVHGAREPATGTPAQVARDVRGDE
jgi:predicted transcriptional regulator